MFRFDFPIFNTPKGQKTLTYLDNAATSQKPQPVIQAITDYYQNYNANPRRGLYSISAQATQAYELAHQKVADFIQARSAKEIIFTRGTTDSLNLLASTITALTGNRTEILLTEMEHHANLVPWQQLAQRTGMQLRFIPLKENFTLDHQQAEQLISEKTALLSVTHVSNVLGTINNIPRLTQLAKQHGAISIIDAAQSAGHIPLNVQQLGADFIAFSAHKMLGPTGIGVLWGREALLEQLPPYQLGGDMINRVSYHDAGWNDLPMKFEAGTPHAAGAVGLSAALDYLRQTGVETIRNHDQELTSYAAEQMKKLPGIKLLMPPLNQHSSVISFAFENIHPHDISSLLDDHGVCVRAGHHCAMPLIKKLKVPATTRASFYLYNTEEDVHHLIQGLKEVIKIFG